MAESSIARARRLTTERIEARAAEERAAEAAQAAAEEAVREADKEEEGGFFSSFFGRAETVDATVEAAQGRQSTDSNQ